MARENSKQKNVLTSFLLLYTPTGQYCKKIKGKLYYFGTAKQEALRRCLEQESHLHAGKGFKPSSSEDEISLKTLCNLYLEHQESRVADGDIGLRQLHDQTSLLRRFARFIGPNRSIADISTIDLQNYRAKLIKAGRAATTINNHISSFKAMFHWALENEVVSSVPNLKAIKKITRKKENKPVFTHEEIGKLINHAGVQMEAMIWLGLNCGFGCTDCAEILWEHVDLDDTRIHFARGKTRTDRSLPLWPETVDALKALPRQNQRVFNTSKGNAWVRASKSTDEGSRVKYTRDHALSKQFSKLLKKAGIKTEKGVGFYTLRRTAATLAARSGDPFAVQRLLGHADLKMASTYVQDISEQTDRVIARIHNEDVEIIIFGGLFSNDPGCIALARTGGT